MKSPKLNKVAVDIGLDLYFYGRKFLHYDRYDIGDVRVDMGDGKPWVPVQDWMKEGKQMTPDQLRHFARYFYERGHEGSDNSTIGRLAELKSFIKDMADEDRIKMEANEERPILCHFYNGCNATALDILDRINLLGL